MRGPLRREGKPPAALDVEPADYSDTSPDVGLEEAFDSTQWRWPVPAEQAYVFSRLEADVDGELATEPDACEGIEHGPVQHRRWGRPSE